MKTMILLRGLTRETQHWGRFPELLAERIPGLCVVPIDLPGNGRANALRSPNRVDALARDARQQVQLLGLPTPYYLVAMSLGAMVAVEWAVQDPQALGACVLINTSMRPFSPWYRRLRPANYATLIRVALAMDSEQWREAAILRMTTRHVTAASALAEQWAEIRRRRPVSAGNALRQLMAAARYRAPSQPPRVPILVLASGGDALVDPACSRQLARAWNVAHAEHASAGHDLCLDDGPWVVEELKRWLNGMQPGLPGTNPATRSHGGAA